jgi:hypothetical protein
MGFGLSAGIPKVETPKVPAVPKVPDVAGAVAGAASGLKGAVTGAASGVATGVKAAVGGGAGGALGGALGGGIGGAMGAVGKGGLSLAGVAGVLAEVAVSFTGGSVDFAMEPHMVLDANASFGDTRFEKGPVWIRVDLTPEQAKANTENLRLYSADGGYDQEKRISEFHEEQGGMVDILFADAPMDASFSLEAIPEDGPAHPIFAQVAYGDLRKTKSRV